MIEFLTSVGFDYDENTKEVRFDEVIKMLEFYEKNHSRKIKADGKEYLVLNADNLEILFPIVNDDDANVDEMDLFYKTDKWQEVDEAYWCEKDEDDYVSVANVQCDFVSLNVCIPNGYKMDLDEDETYKMQFACFGQDCEIFTEEEFEKTHHSLNTESFFNVGGYKNSAVCHFSGIIKEVNLCQNTFLKKEFYHLVITCLGMEIDVYLNKRKVPETVKVGKIASIGGWLAGIFQNIKNH